MKEIIQKGHETLREVARVVSPDEIKSDYIQGVIHEMKETLHGQEDGVAIAAPQINESVRIFVISHKVLKKEEELYDYTKSKVFINPEITNQSKEKVPMEEGCLSVRWWYGKVDRAKQATVEALDENGEKFQMGGSGLVAQIFQHEIDHLDGILFVDKANDLEEYDPPKE